MAGCITADARARVRTVRFNSLPGLMVGAQIAGMQGRRVAVLGAAGFVGANLVPALLRGGADVHVAVRADTDVWRLREVLGDVELHQFDLLDAAAVERGMESIAPEAVVNLVTYRPDRTPDDRATALATNVLAVTNLLEAMRTTGYERLVHLGSVLEREPTTFYGATKASATLLCCQHARQHSHSVVVLRPYSVYGPWQLPARLIPMAVVAARDGGSLDLTAGSHKRDWVYVGDVVEACLLAIVADGIAGEVIDIGTGQLSTNDDVVRAAESATGGRVRRRPGRHPARAWDADERAAPTARASEMLGWTARHDLRAGVSATAEWMRERMDLYRL